jgi:hypothetical protein
MRIEDFVQPKCPHRCNEWLIGRNELSIVQDCRCRDEEVTFPDVGTLRFVHIKAEDRRTPEHPVEGCDLPRSLWTIRGS